MIVLEMTMNYQMALAAMLSVVTCCIVSHILYGHSFDRQLLDRGIDVAQGRGHIEMMETPVLGIVGDNFVSISESVVNNASAGKTCFCQSIRSVLAKRSRCSSWQD